MNSSHGSCTFPRVNYLSLLSPNESAVDVIKQLHFILASPASTNTQPGPILFVQALHTRAPVKTRQKRFWAYTSDQTDQYPH